MPRTRKPVTPEGEARSAVQPPRAPTGLPQGQHKALIDAQRAVPMANQDARMQQAIQQAQAAQQGPPLGDGQALTQPTANPLEPVTAGVGIGAGPGPEAVPAPIIPSTVDDARMARYLPMLEVLADQPDATDATRNFVRRLRGSLPTDITMSSIAK